MGAMRTITLTEEELSDVVAAIDNTIEDFDYRVSELAHTGDYGPADIRRMRAFSKRLTAIVNGGKLGPKP